jgi:hypothetical protein
LQLLQQRAAAGGFGFLLSGAFGLGLAEPP